MKLFILAFFTLCSVAFGQTLTVTADPLQAVGLADATRDFNTSAKRLWDQAELSKVAASVAAKENPVYVAATYVPITEKAYGEARFRDVLNSYAKARQLALESAPTHVALAAKLATIRAAKRAEIQAAIEAAQ